MQHKLDLNLKKLLEADGKYSLDQLEKYEK